MDTPEHTIDTAVPETAATETGAELAGGETAPQAVEAREPDRKKIEEQLGALKRKEAELRRALAIADHPALAEAIRALEGRVYAVTRSEAKMAEGLTKSEAKKRETLEKKLGAARAKRDEIQATIDALEAELAPLGEERARAAEAERKDAMERLLAALATHDDAFRAAGVEASSLVPGLDRLLPGVQAMAETLVATRDAAKLPD